MPDGLNVAAEAAAFSIRTPGREGRPKLLIMPHDPDLTADAIRDALRRSGTVYERGVLVRLALDRMQGGVVAQPLTPESVMREVHRLTRPVRLSAKQDGKSEEVPAALPRVLALAYLDMRGEWEVPALNGIASAPLLHADGTIHAVDGYDTETGMFCENVPDVEHFVPVLPTKEQAEAALLKIRTTWRTFPFKDAAKVVDPALKVRVVDVGQPPMKDETAFLCGLLTAVCRPSLHTAPGLLLHAPAMSGAGTGKGLLARTIACIAFGRSPHAVTQGGTAEELEKRISSELIEGAPVLFLDNFNGVALKSDTLASAITERPARTRLLGKSQMVPLNATAFIVVTGNGLTVSEDLARRFIAAELDADMEDPEQRPFRGDLLAEMREHRAVLLAACLTIWRWGRQNAGNLVHGKPLGSFGQWCEWVRDPLLTLGCKDPADRVSEAKAKDERRQVVGDLLAAWFDHHHDYAIRAADLHQDVKAILDPQGRGRQFIAAALGKMSGTRVAGFVLTEQRPAGKWSATTYAVAQVKREQPAWEATV